MEIRRATSAEHQLLSSIARESKSHWGYSDADMAAWAEELRVSARSIERQPTFAAETDGQVTGFFQLAQTNGGIEIDHFWVLPAHMGEGVGRALLARAVEEAAELGFRELAIDADPHAEAFYLACGAVGTGVTVAAPTASDPQRRRPQLVLALGEPAANSHSALRPFAAVAAWGLLAALLLAAIPSGMDWYSNPSGIFRSKLDTNWTILLETLWSWLWPIALLTVPLAVVLHWLRRRG